MQQVKADSRLGVSMDWEAWVSPNDPSMSIEEAVERQEALGNKVLMVDYPGRRIKVMQESSADTFLYVCEHPECGAYSYTEQTVKDHEMSEHADAS